MSAARALLAAGLALAAASLAGCGWFGGGDKKAGALPEIRSTVTPKVAWTANVGKSGGYRFAPDAEGGRVYAAAADGTITVLEEDSGRVLARFETQKKLSGGLLADESRLIVGTLKGEVIALGMDGKVAWTGQVAGELLAPASASRGVAVVRAADGRIFGFSIADGKRLWVYQRPTPALLLRANAGALAVASDVVAGYPGGKLVALDIGDGKLTWEATVSLPRGATELERIADVAGLPVIDGSRVCAAAFQGKVACFEIQTRDLAWSRDISSASGLAVDAKNVYLVDDKGAVQALDKGNGSSLWRQDKLAARRLGTPLVVNGNVVVGDVQGYLHVLAPEDGALVGRVATDGTEVTAIVPTVAGVLVQTAGGSVVSLRF